MTLCYRFASLHHYDMKGMGDYSFIPLVMRRIKFMTYSIKRAAVLGSGLFGSSLAAHLTNAGIPTLLLDYCPETLTEDEKKRGLSLNDKQVKNRIAFESKQLLLGEKPSPIISNKSLDLIDIGNFTDDMKELSEIDWIIECVEEDIDRKKQLLAKLDQYRKEGSIVSTNTFGLSLKTMIADCSEDMKSHFLSTHFFHPPRYLKLLELTPTTYTNRHVFSYMKQFTENVLGKRVVIAKDTPNFIANRIGMYSLLITVHEMVKTGLTVSEVDSITGQLIGRPPSATLRTIDIIGLDLFQKIIDNVATEEKTLQIPNVMKQMIENGSLGVATNKGFYTKTADNSILQLNINTMKYEKCNKLMTNAVKLTNKQTKTAEKVKTLISQQGDLAGDFVWNIMKATLLYATQLVGNIADNITSIDETMKWGFGWELGPFEIWDEIGLEQSVFRMEAEGDDVPQWIKQMIQSGYNSFYTYEQSNIYFYNDGIYELYKRYEMKGN